MTDFLLAWHSPTTLVFLLGSAAYAVFHRLSNAEISLKWSARIKPPEPSAAELHQIEAAREAVESDRWAREKAERAAREVAKGNQ